MRKLICLLVLAMLVGGCTTFNAQTYPLSETYLPTNPEGIQVFRNPPPIQHIPIGEVEASAASASKTSSIYRRLKKDAANMGGDAIVIVDEGTEYYGGYPAPTITTTTGSGQIDSNSFNYSGSTQSYGGGVTPVIKKKIFGIVIKYIEKIVIPKE